MFKSPTEMQASPKEPMPAWFVCFAVLLYGIVKVASWAVSLTPRRKSK
jgi:hypothetical protein